MPNPIFTSQVQDNVAVDGSRYVLARIYLNFLLDGSSTFTLRCPEESTVTFRFWDAGVPHLVGAISTTVNTADTPVPGLANHTYGVTAVTNSPSPSVSTLTFSLIGNSQKYWEIELTSPVRRACAVLDSSSSAATSFLAQFFADAKVVSNTASGPGLDDDPIALTGTVDYTSFISGFGGLPAAKPPVPKIAGQWQQVAPFLISAPTDPGPAPTTVAPLTVASSKVAPPVYASTAVNFALSGTYDATPSPANPTATVVKTITPKRRNIILLLDGTGSMLSSMGGGATYSKWEFATRAAHIWADLLVAFRKSVSDLPGTENGDGIIVFDNPSGAWGPATPATHVPIEVPAGALGAVTALDLPTLPLSLQSGYTPIGDGLMAAMNAFIAHGGGNVQPTTEYVIVLMTDGYENCGHVYVDSSNPPGAGTIDFAAARTATPALTTLGTKLRIITVGMGPVGGVQENVLNHLPNSTGAAVSGMYRLVTDASQLANAFADQFNYALKAQRLSASTSDNKTWTFDVTPNEHRLAFICHDLQALQWDATCDILVSWKPQSGGAFTQVAGGGATAAGVTFKSRPKHGIVTVDLASVPSFDVTVATTWQVQFRKGGTAQTLGLVLGQPAGLIGMVDLFVTCDFTFDKDEYGIGEPIGITCELKAGGVPITNATVEVQLEHPAEGLGTFLAVHGKGYVPNIPRLTTVGHDDRRQRFVDPPHPKLWMLQQLLAQNGLAQLPVLFGPGQFVDGTNRLHDAHKTGTYSNDFAKTDKEGSFTWTFIAKGQLPDGSRFARTITLSKWVGVKVDPASSAVNVQLGVQAPPGLLGALITVVPRARNNEYLGPFREGLVRMVTSRGELQGLVGQYDGTYTNTLYYKPGEVPRVGITIGGVKFPPAIVSDNPICRLLGRLPATYADLIEEIEHLLCGPHDREKEHALHELIERIEKIEDEHPLQRVADKLKNLFKRGTSS